MCKNIGEVLDILSRVYLKFRELRFWSVGDLVKFLLVYIFVLYKFWRRGKFNGDFWFFEMFELSRWDRRGDLGRVF